MSERPTQAEYWNSRAGEHWSEFYARYDEILGDFGRAAIDAAAPAPGERFLDVGCGSGGTTLEIARRVEPGGSVVGIDLSAQQLATGRERAVAAGLGNVEFVQGDAGTYAFDEGPFDAFVSRFGVMFFDDPKAGFTNLVRALRPGGRVTFVCWQDALVNEWIAVPGMAIVEHLGMPDLGEPGAPGPFAFADADRLRTILVDAGLDKVSIDPITIAQRFGDGVDHALDWMMQTDIAQDMLAGAEPARADAAIASVREALQPFARPEGVYLSGAAWLVTTGRP